MTNRFLSGSRAHRLCALLLPLLVPAGIRAERPVHQAPPPAPPIVVATNNFHPGPILLSGGTLYSIGAPTDEEQQYLEYINRSRANPPAEGVRLANTTDPNVRAAYNQFGVDTNLLVSQFNAIPAVPPLAMNAKLIAAARVHSQEMFTYAYQGHYGTNGNGDTGQRITAQGYNWSTYGENVFAYADDVFYGHAGFNVDWGDGTGGMQTPPGHRQNIHSANFREVGVGVVDGSNGPVGPQLVTQDFGSRSSLPPFITGVAYYDLNTNGFYDAGEGIGGVTVTVPGSTNYAVTADSGGYAVPCSTNGSYALTFTATNLAWSTNAVISGGNNVKIDYVPAYTPPTISGPKPAYLNTSNFYSITPVGAATSYDWQQIQLPPYTVVEGAEAGLGNMTAWPAGSIIRSTFYAAAGSYSFQFDQGNALLQSLTLNPVLLPATNSVLSFAKRLSWVVSSQIAHAQVSVDGGASWVDVWTQTGDDTSGDGAFSTINVPLTSYAGKYIQIRFAYTIPPLTSYYLGDDVGFFLDNVAVSNATQPQPPVITAIPTGTTFAFSPIDTNNYVLQARAHINSRTLPWGPAFTVSVVTPPPAIQLVSKPTLAAGQIQIDFTVANYRNGMTFQLWKSPTVNTGYTQDTAAVLGTLVANSKYRLSTSTGTAARTFYRVKGSY